MDGENRPDIARQMLEKLLVIDPDSPWGLAAMGSCGCVRANWIRPTRCCRPCAHAIPRTKATRGWPRWCVTSTEGEKLANMRLLARAGRKAEAAEVARELFPQGAAPTLGGLALEYHQIVGTSARGGESLRQQASLR